MAGSRQLDHQLGSPGGDTLPLRCHGVGAFKVSFGNSGNPQLDDYPYRSFAGRLFMECLWDYASSCLSQTREQDERCPYKTGEAFPPP